MNNKNEQQNELRDKINRIPPVRYLQVAESRLNRLIKPKGSLGRLEEFAKDIVAITGNERPSINNKFVCVFAGDHGVCEEGVSLFDQAVTAQMVRNFLTGGAAINAIADSAGASVLVVDAGINENMESLYNLSGDDKSGNFINAKIKNCTKNINKEQAMSYDDAVNCLIKGMEIARVVKLRGAEICSTGDMGIGNTTPSSAITCFYSKKNPIEVCGRGTGVNSKIIKKKSEIIEKAIKNNISDKNDPIAVLAGIGGFEIGEIAGFIIGCALNRIPVVIDGFISTAGALIAVSLNPNIIDYLFPGHISKEKGHKIAIKTLIEIGGEPNKDRKTPILNLSMRLGEGTGAVIAMKIIEIALASYNNMLTFEEAEVLASKLNV